MRPARRLGEIVHAEHPPSARVHVGDERLRQRRPAMAHDQHVVRLLERDALLDHEAPDACASVIAQVTVQLLDPRLGREDERDLRLAHGVADRRNRRCRSAPGSNGAAWCSGVAPVARTSVIVPVSSADAIRAAASDATAIVTLASSEPCSGPLPLLVNASTCTSVAT